MNKLNIKKINILHENIENIDNLFKNNICFGQKGEDYLVNLILDDTKNGIYIDIGAHDGIRFSNSYQFSNMGWKGILVEAHPDYYNICFKNRNNKNTKIYNVACSNSDNNNTIFYSNYRGSLSTLNPNLNNFFKKNYKGYYVDINHKQKVENFTNGPIIMKTRTINSIIEENRIFLNNNTKNENENENEINIDLITIDVDGSEEFVLGGFDINKWKPRVIILEVSTVRSVVENFMNLTNYTKVYDNNLNAIYCRDKFDVDKFNNKLTNLLNNNIEIKLYDTGHPLGN